ncbi:MAG: phage protein NinX family protein [Citrobacter portucalensis]|nr:phage protein NinX family protein [Citrobacter portucalensis]
MKNYSEMSDFEINLAVAHIVIGSGGYDWNSDKKEVYLSARDGGEFLPNAYFDPCNNPSDAWKITSENMISICAYKRANPGMKSVSWWEADYFGEHITRNDNPLRAAMIVFLMMQEAKNG